MTAWNNTKIASLAWRAGPSGLPLALPWSGSSVTLPSFMTSKQATFLQERQAPNHTTRFAEATEMLVIEVRRLQRLVLL